MGERGRQLLVILCCLSVRLPVCLSVCLSVCPSARLSVCLSLSLWLSVSCMWFAKNRAMNESQPGRVCCRVVPVMRAESSERDLRMRGFKAVLCCVVLCCVVLCCVVRDRRRDGSLFDGSTTCPARRQQ
jgi:hypothetical protein